MRSGKQKTRKIKKLNKIYGFVCAVLIAICFAFSTANYAYAASSGTWSGTGGKSNLVYIQGNNNSTWYYYTYQNLLDNVNLYQDVYIKCQDVFQISNFSQSNIYSGFFQSRNTFNITAHTTGVANNIDIDLLDIETDFDGDFTDFTTIVEGGQTNSSTVSTRNFSVSRNNIMYFTDKKFNGGDIYISYTLHLKFSATNTSVNSVGLIYLGVSITDSNWSCGCAGTYTDGTVVVTSPDLNANDPNILGDVAQQQSEIDTINNSVDSAIASAAPDSSQQISAVGQMMQGHSTFWSAQQNAVTFWKDALNYAFDFSVVSYLATGLSIVLIIILFIFVLRL